jgi:hypothetical protein
MATFCALPIHRLDKVNEHAFFEAFSGQVRSGNRDTGRGILNVTQVIQIINNRACEVFQVFAFNNSNNIIVSKYGICGHDAFLPPQQTQRFSDSMRTFHVD